MAVLGFVIIFVLANYDSLKKSSTPIKRLFAGIVLSLAPIGYAVHVLPKKFYWIKISSGASPIAR